MKEHSKKSRKGSSRSKNNQLANLSGRQSSETGKKHPSSETTEKAPAKGRKQNQINKSSSIRSITEEDACNFGFTVFCCSLSGKWFVAELGNGRTCAKHTNHLPLLSSHISTNNSNLPPNVLSIIKSLIVQGITSTAIAGVVSNDFGITISHEQINAMKSKQVDDLIRASGENPASTAIARLIQIFENDDNVSFTYVTHQKDEGFVTFQKKRRSKKTVSIEQHHAISEKEINEWREDLKLDHSNEVVVAIAWSHNEEARKLSMFPEFSAIDLTFGTNKQNRPLLVLSGIDGCKKTFTGVRCLMPNKSQEAYSWTLRVAVPNLIGTNAVRSMRCIASDGEQAIADAIENAKNSGILPRTLVHRLDFYHLFIQKWLNDCKPAQNASEVCRTALQNIYEWVTSWVYNVETEAEYQDSSMRYNSYFNSVKHVLGDNLSSNVQITVGRVTTSIKNCGYHNFLFVTTLGYAGSTIVEATNVGIKKGTFAVKAGQNLDAAGINHIAQVDNHSQKCNIEMARHLERKKHWSASNTKDALTSYSEGIAVRNFDIRSVYCTVCTSQTSWFVFDKDLLEELSVEYNESPVSKYSRVRTVTIDQDGYMNCSCGLICQYLWLCPHAMAVLGDDTFILPDLFHIRWWEVYNYFFLTEHGKSNLSDLHQCMDQVVEAMSSTAFGVDGRYRGCNVSGCGFMNKTHTPAVAGTRNMKVAKAIIRRGPIQLGSRDYLKHLDDSSAPDIICPVVETIELGGASRTIMFPSPGRHIRGSNLSIRARSPCKEDTTSYHILMSLLNSAKTPAQQEEMIGVARRMTNQFLSENRMKPVLPNDAVMYGEDDSSGHRDGKRRKNIYERFNK